MQSTSSISSLEGASERELSRLEIVEGSSAWDGDSSGSGAGSGRCCLLTDTDTSSEAHCTGGFAAASSETAQSESGTVRHISPSSSSQMSQHSSGDALDPAFL